MKNIHKVASGVPEKNESSSGISAILSKNRNLIKGLLLAGSIASTGCATLGYKEMTVVSEQCHNMDSCHNSLLTIEEKGVDPKLDLSWLKKYTGRLDQSIGAVESEYLKNMDNYVQSLETIEKYKAPDWADRLRNNPSEKTLKILKEEASGILENLEDEKWVWQHKLSPSGSDTFKLLAQSALDLVNLKLERLAVKTKNPWFGGSNVATRDAVPDAGIKRDMPTESGTSANNSAIPDAGTPSPENLGQKVLAPTPKEEAKISPDAGSAEPKSPITTNPPEAGIMGFLKSNPLIIDQYSKNPSQILSFLPADTVQNGETSKELVAFLDKNKAQTWYAEAIEKMKKDIQEDKFSLPQSSLGGIKVLYDKYLSGIPATDLAELSLIVKNFHDSSDM